MSQTKYRRRYMSLVPDEENAAVQVVSEYTCTNPVNGLIVVAGQVYLTAEREVYMLRTMLPRGEWSAKGTAPTYVAAHRSMLLALPIRWNSALAEPKNTAALLRMSPESAVNTDALGTRVYLPDQYGVAHASHKISERCPHCKLRHCTVCNATQHSRTPWDDPCPGDGYVLASG